MRLRAFAVLAAFSMLVAACGDDTTIVTVRRTVPPGSSSTTTSTTSTTTSTTTTSTTMPLTYEAGPVLCDWYRIETVAVPPEAVYLAAMGDIETLRSEYADLAEELGYGSAPPLPAGPPPLESWIPPADPGPFVPPSVPPGEFPDPFRRWLCGLNTYSDGTMDAVSEGITDIIGTATAVVDAAAEGVDMLFGNTEFPCGDGGRGHTICGDLPFPEGETLVVAMALGDMVPIADPEQYFQYGFVFDRDGDPANNFTADPAWPKDYFDGTDLWYVANYDPMNGWMMFVNGENFEPLSTGARIIVFEYGMLLVVPTAEIGDLAAAGYRVTAFRHLGDYGMNPPHIWNGDTVPPVGEPLAGIAGA